MTGSRRAQVAKALIAAAGAPVSGEVLAEELGVSRVAIGKHVTALREAGFEIDSVRRQGYRLISAPPLALPETVAPLLEDPLWIDLVGGAETASTNDDAKRLAREGAPEGTVVVAARQTAGRGRLGREWDSPEGGAYFSAILRPAIAPALAPALALVVATGVADGLSRLGIETGLKWPNDVLLDGRKLVGILLEMSAEADKVEWIVAGVGINVCRDERAPGGYAYTQDVADASPALVTASILDGISRAYGRYLAGGFAACAGEYAARDVLLGRDVTVSNAEGGRVASGIAGGVDDAGRLLVGGQAVYGGEVTLRASDGGAGA